MSQSENVPGRWIDFQLLGPRDHLQVANRPGKWPVAAGKGVVGCHRLIVHAWPARALAGP